MASLSSFFVRMLLKPYICRNIAKCLFVVDRKDLDRQTREEFNKFQEGCVEENTNTETLVERLTSEDYRDKVIVTTIQKLGLALDEDNKRIQEKKKRGELTYKERLAPLKDQRIVMILKLFFKNIFCCRVRTYCSINLFICCVFFKNRGPCKSKKLRFGKEIFNSFMVLSKL